MRYRMGWSAGLGSVIAVVVASTAGAADIPVTSDAGDTSPGTLRAAIADANGSAGEDRILIPAGPAIQLLGSTPITEDLIIDGADGSRRTIEAPDLDRVFTVTGGADLQVLDLTLTGGDKYGDPVSAVDDGPGGAIAAEDGTSAISIMRTTVTGNRAAHNGGGIYASGPITITDSVVSGNSATGDREPHGGGAFSLVGITVTSSTVSDNGAWGDGGGLRAPDVDVIRSTFDQNGADDAGGAMMAENMSIDESTFTRNRSIDSPGDVWSNVATITDSTFRANKSGLTVRSGALTVARSTFENGGGVSGTTLDMSQTTVVGSGPVGAARGTIRNSTLAGNYRNLALSHTTDPTATLTVISSIVADPLASTNCDGAFGTAGTLVSGGHNLFDDDGTCPAGATDRVVAQSYLGPLADNGGPVQTRLPGTPALDMGINPQAFATDQRGATRTVDNAVADAPGSDGTDAGAVELQPGETALSPPPAVPAPPTATPPTTAPPKAVSAPTSFRRTRAPKLVRGVLYTGLTLRCPTACSVNAALSYRRRTYGTARFTLKPGAARQIKIRLSRRARARLDDRVTRLALTGRSGTTTTRRAARVRVP